MKKKTMKRIFILSAFLSIISFGASAQIEDEIMERRPQTELAVFHKCNICACITRASTIKKKHTRVGIGKAIGAAACFSVFKKKKTE